MNAFFFELFLIIALALYGAAKAIDAFEDWRQARQTTRRSTPAERDERRRKVLDAGSRLGGR